MEYEELPTREKIQTKTLRRGDFAARHERRKCPMRSKNSYPTEKSATYYKNRLLKDGLAEYLDVYKCNLCRFWHLTSQRPRNGNNKR